MLRNVKRQLPCLFAVVYCCLVFGCTEKLAFVPVTGTVTVKGKPVEAGRIMFQRVVGAKDGAVSATGTIENGEFTLYTVDPGDGVVPGQYYPVVLDPYDDQRPKKDRLGMVQMDDRILEVTADGENKFDIDITARDLKYAIPED